MSDPSANFHEIVSKLMHFNGPSSKISCGFLFLLGVITLGRVQVVESFGGKELTK